MTNTKYASRTYLFYYFTLYFKIYSIWWRLYLTKHCSYLQQETIITNKACKFTKDTFENFLFSLLLVKEVFFLWEYGKVTQRESEPIHSVHTRCATAWKRGGGGHLVRSSTNSVWEKITATRTKTDTQMQNENKKGNMFYTSWQHLVTKKVKMSNNIFQCCFQSVSRCNW